MTTGAHVPPGWKLVPIEPTAEMCAAFNKAEDLWSSQHCDNMREWNWSRAKPRWDAMLSAAPEPTEKS